MRRTIIPLFSDTHGGNILGLMSPETPLPMEGPTGEIEYLTPAMTDMQVHLWGLWMDGAQYAQRLAGEDEIIPIHNGDATQGNKYAAAWVSTRISDQLVIADCNMRTWLDMPQVQTFRYAVGTGAHNFGEGSAEYLLSQIHQARYPGKDIKTVYHGLADINGVPIDYAHHGRRRGAAHG